MLKPFLLGSVCYPLLELLTRGRTHPSMALAGGLSAAAFRRMAETDRQHALRFAQYLEVLASGHLFREAQRVSWVCLACGQLHTGCEPPSSCPGCSGGQSHFIRTNFYPFSVEA